MSKKVASLTIFCLLFPTLVSAVGYPATSPPNISAPDATSLNVELVGSWPVANVVDLYVYANQAYVAHHLDRWDPEPDAILSVLDISDPAHPSEINRIEGPNGYSYQAVHADSSYIYTAEDWPTQILAYQHTDTENYVCWNYFDYHSKVVEMWSQSGYWLILDANLLGDTGNGLQVYKPAPTQPYDKCEPVTSYEVTGVVTAATYDDQYAYIGTSDGSLWILYISDPKFPSRVSLTQYTGGSIDAIATAPGYVYLAQGTDVKIIDISIPESPEDAGSFTSPVELTQLGAHDGYLYITFENGMYVYDVRDSSTPVQAGYYLDYDDEGFGTALHLADDLIFAAGLDTMNILRFTGAQPLPQLLLQPLQEGIEINGVLAPFPCVLPGNTEESVQDIGFVDCLPINLDDELTGRLIKKVAVNMYVDCPVGFVEFVMEMVGWQAHGGITIKSQMVQMLLLIMILDKFCEKPNSFSSNPLGYQSITDGSVGLKLEQGAVRFKVAHQAMDLDIVTESATARSAGANDFGVAYDPDTALSWIACYQGTVEVQPANTAISPISLPAGYWVEVTSEQVSPITEITYKVILPLVMNIQ